MASVTVDMTAAAETVPNSLYRLAITKAELKQTKPPKTGQYINLTLVVLEGEFTGFRSNEIVSLSEKAASISAKFFKAIGLDYLDENGKPRKDFTFDTDDIEGLEVFAELVEKTDDFGTKSKVKRWLTEEQYNTAHAAAANVDEEEVTSRRGRRA